ncbi:hypothetical protein MuYL_3561 [Mucilaginibacter xinganensis]|uniref:Uncharacterized protein n=1 Tax=Mucilaginibacter xinganensis TaxID=1234841 RepID=A0A223P031_9SPHI|nr:hypothetical protein MuYL_3561 [Mucilaginibacter xinganensis]
MQPEALSQKCFFKFIVHTVSLTRWSIIKKQLSWIAQQISIL